MRKWIAALAIALLATAAYAQVSGGLPIWTTSTRFGDTPGKMGFNITTNLPEWVDGMGVWHSFAQTDSPKISGTIQQTTGFSAAGTPLPTCDASVKGAQAYVSDATAPTYLGAYTSGGTVNAPVFCDGSGWVTY